MSKRAAPGDDAEKNPLADVELTDEDAQRLKTVQQDIARAELVLERRAQEKLMPVYANRRAVVKTIPKFWAVALMNSPVVAVHAQHVHDQTVLAALEDIWLVRDPVESRAFTLEFHFKENPYFSDSVLKKVYKYNPGPGSANDAADADGVTESMLDFSWERDVEPQSTTIQWKDDSKNLIKQYPRVAGEEEDDLPQEAGSFFHFFTVAKDPFDIGVVIANEIFPEAIEYFLGQAGDDLDEEDEEDSEDDDEEAEEIDLEKPRSKKPKKA